MPTPPITTTPAVTAVAVTFSSPATRPAEPAPAPAARRPASGASAPPEPSAQLSSGEGVMAVVAARRAARARCTKPRTAPSLKPNVVAASS
jgi:hypothetical protein